VLGEVGEFGKRMPNKAPKFISIPNVQVQYNCPNLRQTLVGGWAGFQKTIFQT
jgi:hypothetical protein